MDEKRYNAIKEFMNGRDVSSSFSDPAHESEYSFNEFLYVWTKEHEVIEEPVIEEPEVQ